MLLKLRVIGEHASDLELLLDKCPDKLHSTTLPFGVAHVFFSDLSSDAATVDLVLDADAIRLSSNELHDAAGLTSAASLSAAIARVFSTALAARSPRRPDLVTTALPLEACVSSFYVSRGSNAARTLFEPLGYRVSIDEHVLESPKGMARQTVRLAKLCSLYELLSHLYVLGPVLDGHAQDRLLDDQREALIMHAEGVVRGHPEGDRIMQAYAARRPSSVGMAFDRLVAAETIPGQTSTDTPTTPSRLDESRLEAIVLELREAAAHSVIDLGCGDGKLLARLVREKALTRIVGLDVSHRALEAAATRMKLDRRSGKKSERMELLHGSVFYSDQRLSGFDAAVLADVVAHLPPDRLADAEKVVFREARPATIVVTMHDLREDGSASTNLEDGWSSNQFDAWASDVSERHAYRVRLLSPGSSSQTTRMAVFSR